MSFRIVGVRFYHLLTGNMARCARHYSNRNTSCVIAALTVDTEEGERIGA